jgi:hypothetical protein
MIENKIIVRKVKVKMTDKDGNEIKIPVKTEEDN